MYLIMYQNVSRCRARVGCKHAVMFKSDNNAFHVSTDILYTLKQTFLENLVILLH